MQTMQRKFLPYSWQFGEYLLTVSPLLNPLGKVDGISVQIRDTLGERVNEGAVFDDIFRLLAKSDVVLIPKLSEVLSKFATAQKATE